MTNRCRWVNLNNPLYVDYHDKEWGRVTHDEHHLIEMFLLESMQAGLSWECVLNKRENYEKAFDNFDIDKIIEYDDNKFRELLNYSCIIRNKLKIRCIINNSKIIKNIISEYGSFDNYIWHFTNNKVITYKRILTRSSLSDKISDDLKSRGMTFVGSVIIFSYLQAIGIINSHDENCDFRNID